MEWTRPELAREVLGLLGAGQPSDGDSPLTVIVMGGVAAGKTTLVNADFGSGFVVIDAAAIFLRLCRGEELDFPGELQKGVELVGSALAFKAIQQKRPLVTEVIGADHATVEQLIDALELAGYQVRVLAVTCDVDEAARRNLARGPDCISAFYAEPYQVKWILEACRTLALQAEAGPSGPPTYSVTGARVYEDADYTLYKQDSWLGMLTSYYVYGKYRSVHVKLTGREKGFMLATLAEMMCAGVTIEQIATSGMFRDLCDAVLSRPDARWAVFFDADLPKATACRYL